MNHYRLTVWKLGVVLLLIGGHCLSTFAQNEVFNNGALLFVNNQAGTIKNYNVGDMPTLYVNGEINNNSGTLQNAAGEIQLTGDFTNVGTLNSTGDEVFVGGSNANVSGTLNSTTTTNNFNNLIIVKPSSTITLVTDVNVKDNINFVNGIIITGANTLYELNSTSTAIVNGVTSGTDKYVQGKLKWKTDGTSTYIFPIGHNSQNAQGFSISPSGTNPSNILGYLETNTTSPLKTVAYCDMEGKPGSGVYPIGSGTASPDGALDQVTFNLSSPLQWNVTNPGGGISTYNITALANGGQDIVPVTSTNTSYGDIRYLLKNGEPGNTGVSTGSGGSDFPTVGFLACPNQYTLSGMTSFSVFTINGANSGSTSLPVKYLYLRATPIDNSYIHLDWATAIEIDNKGFDIERSVDGVHFDKIGWVNGHGNATQVNYYSEDDKRVSSDIDYYYRLNQIDNNGNHAYSSIVTARLFSEKSFVVSDFLPTQLTEKTRLNIFTSIDRNLTFDIYDALGQHISRTERQLQAGSSRVDFDFSDIASGTYSALIQSNGEYLSRKFVIVR